MTLESIQIHSLQSIIKCQDELIKEGITDIVGVWRNECYRLIARNAILEEECVRITKLMKDEVEKRESLLRFSLNEEILALSRHVETTINDKLKVVRVRIDKLNWSVTQIRRQHRELRNKLITERNQQYETEIGRSASSCLDDGPTCKYGPSSAGPPAAIASLLHELKSLEIEARHLLINK